MSGIAPSVLNALRALDPDATYTQAGGPQVKSSKGDVFYVKTGHSRNYDQWKGEAESLKAMDAAAPGICPRLIAFGEDAEARQRPYMISEYKQFTSLSSASGKILAKRMALELHEPQNSEAGAKGRFGFEWPTYCGATRLENGWFDTWDEAYASLIKTLLDGLRQEGRSYSEVCDLGDQVVAKVIPFLLGPPRLKDVQPVVLHGDLWSGNAGTLASGEPIIFDPASYYGHNEADLAIARIFGGFGAPFFAEYHKHRPKSPPIEEYDERVALYELFHYLNHTLLFGTSYASPSISRMRRLLKFVEGKT
ncbi:hypothetical protein FRC04_010406 [Tulasnella sp. 424]|nr:hypothetical protein FRC04_010406 [Tulasnella sp. 424]KAG8978658.1 hypothetical protein FRC05_009930 [Tulasnella sp. 425]